MPTFSYPALLAPFGALAVLCAALGAWAQARPGLGLRVIGQKPLWQGLGMALILAGLGLGLAEPRWGLPESPRLTVHIVMDASRSMLAEDAAGANGKSVSRWKASISALERILSQPQPGLRYSIDLITGDEIPLLPPGEDRRLIVEALSAVEPGEIGSPGTSFGRTLPQVIAQIDKNAPSVVLLMSDGEETWQAPDQALQFASVAFKEAKLPLYTLTLGGTKPVTVPVSAPAPVPSSIQAPPVKEPLQSAAHPDFMKQLAESTGGIAFANPDEAAKTLKDLASGKAPLPAARSLQPTHPELGAWIAMLGLALWLLFAGKPMTRWRPVFMLALMLLWPSTIARAQSLQRIMPNHVKAWLADQALAKGDLATAQTWRPTGGPPDFVLLAAEIDLRSGQDADALRTLEPLIGQGVQRPLPAWRAPALLMAAHAQLRLGKREEARDLLERLLLEQPGQPDAIADLQTLVKDPSPPPPPDPKKPPPPPPPRPSQGAQKDELEGFKQRMPKPKQAPAGVKDL